MPKGITDFLQRTKDFYVRPSEKRIQAAENLMETRRTAGVSAPEGAFEDRAMREANKRIMAREKQKRTLGKSNGGAFSEAEKALEQRRKLSRSQVR